MDYAEIHVYGSILRRSTRRTTEVSMSSVFCARRRSPTTSPRATSNSTPRWCTIRFTHNIYSQGSLSPSLRSINRQFLITRYCVHSPPRLWVSPCMCAEMCCYCFSDIKAKEEGPRSNGIAMGREEVPSLWNHKDGYWASWMDSRYHWRRIQGPISWDFHEIYCWASNAGLQRQSQVCIML
jgi:hypothetical protein